jgi:tetratricopeptide (TPR) repeat protein
MSILDTLVKEGNKAQMENNPGEALTFFMQALDTGLIRQDVYAGIGFALNSMGQYENATHYLNKALEVDPNFIPAIEGLKQIKDNSDNENLNKNMGSSSFHVGKSSLS